MNATPVPSTSPPMRPETAAPSASKRSDAEVQLGPHIESIAALFGIHPKDVAVAIASVLGGVAGPYAGFVTPVGHRVRTGVNVLSLGTSSPAASALEDLLLHPIRTRSRYVRGRAQGMSRTLVDQWVFGDHDTNSKDRTISQTYPWMNERDHKLAGQQYSAIKSTWFAPAEFDEQELPSALYYLGNHEAPPRVLTGSEHLPSVLFERLELSNLKNALHESIHREALFFQPSGGLFSRSTLSTTKDEALAADLAGYLVGKDVAFAPVHRDQGHGTFEHARVHLWGSVSAERIGAALHDLSSSWNDVLRSCLLWDATPWVSTNPLPACSRAAMKLFGRVVQRVLEMRLFGKNHHQLRLMLHPSSYTRYSRLRLEFDEHLVRVPETSRQYIVQFHDLPERLYWMFSLFRREEEQDPRGPKWSPITAAFCTAQHAIENHLERLQKARDMAAGAEASRSLKTLTAILKRHGPCNLRAMQRSSNNLRVSSLRPGLELLRSQGRVGVDDQHRYYLTTKEN